MFVCFVLFVCLFAFSSFFFSVFFVFVWLWWFFLFLDWWLLFGAETSGAKESYFWSFLGEPKVVSSSSPNMAMGQNLRYLFW